MANSTLATSEENCTKIEAGLPAQDPPCGLAAHKGKNESLSLVNESSLNLSRKTKIHIVKGRDSNTSPRELWIWGILATAIISWQLFLPPIIGLADQGDFVRILGPLGYAPKPKSPEHK